MKPPPATSFGTLAWTDDLDEIWGYMTTVRGIHGAGMFDADGLPMALGRECAPLFHDRAPEILEAVFVLDSRRDDGVTPPVASLLVEDDERFWYACRLSGFWIVVTGTRGSFELFKGRIERCASMSKQVLRDRRFIQS